MRTRVLALLCLAALILGVAAAPAFAVSTYSEAKPAPGSASMVAKPLISVRVSDPAGISTGFQIKVDGITRTPKVTWIDANTVVMSYQQVTALANGTHTVYASVFTGAGRTSYTWTFTIAAPPTITSLTPADGTETDDSRPTVSALVNGNGLPLTSYGMTVDGAPVAATYNSATKVLSYVPAADLQNGSSYAVAVSATTAAGTANAAWSFEVQLYPRIPDTTVCTDCHTGFPGSHPMDYCDGCHAADAPVLPYWNMDYASPHDASRLVGMPCDYCHAEEWPVVPRHPADDAASHVTTTDMSGCTCHVGDLLREHSRYTTDAGGDLTCMTCHSSADPAVTGAVAGGDTSCVACHTIVDGHGFDEAQHTAAIDSLSVAGTWTMQLMPSVTHAGQSLNAPLTYSAACTTCHVANVGEEHAKATSAPTNASVCLDCHPAPRNTIAGAWDGSCATAGCHTAVGQEQHASAAPLADHTVAASLTNVYPAGEGCSSSPGGPTYVRTPCHTVDLVQEHNRKIGGFTPFPTQMISKTISVSCAQCHGSAAYESLAGAWDGTCDGCHPDNHSVAGTPRYDEVHAVHQASRYYDGGYTSRTGTPVAGINAMDAHGPLRTASAGTAVPYGCGNQTCHTQFYIDAGLDSYYPANRCETCHGPNIAPLAPYAGSYSWESQGLTDGESYTTALTVAVPGTLPAASVLTFKTYYDIEADWDYGYVQISTDSGATWTNLPGNLTTATDPYGINLGNGITGMSDGEWIDGYFDLSAYAGQSVLLRFDYVCDAYVYGDGWCLDNIVVGPAGSPVWSDDAETMKSEITVTSDQTPRWTRFTMP